MLRLCSGAPAYSDSRRGTISRFTLWQHHTVNAAWKLHNLHLTQAHLHQHILISPSSRITAHPVMAAVLCCDRTGRDYGKHLHVVGVWPPFLWVGRGETIARAAVRQGVWGAGIVLRLLLLLRASLFVSGTIETSSSLLDYDCILLSVDVWWTHFQKHARMFMSC